MFLRKLMSGSVNFVARLHDSDVLIDQQQAISVMLSVVSSKP
jgi:hypothetical protein